MTRILLAESNDFSSRAMEHLRRHAEVEAADLDRPGLLDAVRDVNVLWVRLRNMIDAEIIDAAPGLRFIVTPTTGLNHIDLEAAGKRGVTVLSLQGESDFLRNIRATAEHTIGLMLALIRRIPAASAHVEQGGWTRDLFRGHELFNSTVGIVGYGRLGRIVARYVSAFDARVLVSDPRLQLTGEERGLRNVPLADMLRESDIVTLHVNLDEGTRGFFGAHEFESMKTGARFINTSRGELVDEEALLLSLESGRLAGAALDVLSDELRAGGGEHPLVRYALRNDNLIITPHIGGCTFESMAQTEMFMAEKLCAAL